MLPAAAREGPDFWKGSSPSGSELSTLSRSLGPCLRQVGAGSGLCSLRARGSLRSGSHLGRSARQGCRAPTVTSTSVSLFPSLCLCLFPREREAMFFRALSDLGSSGASCPVPRHPVTPHLISLLQEKAVQRPSLKMCQPPWQNLRASQTKLSLPEVLGRGRKPDGLSWALGSSGKEPILNFPSGRSPLPASLTQTHTLLFLSRQ